jgi:hypothetical protein
LLLVPVYREERPNASTPELLKNPESVVESVFAVLQQNSDVRSSSA